MSLRTLIYLILVVAPLALILSAVDAPLAAGLGITEITAALDRAQSPSEIARQAAFIEAMTNGRGTTAEALTQLTRAYYLLGEGEKDKKSRLGYLDGALKVSERALAARPGDTYALYWRSMALLQKSDVVGGISALRMVKEALRNLEAVEAIDVYYDSAGACRTRGKVLMDAPSWAFIGDKKKGVALLEKAKALAPASLINRLYLAEAYAVTGRRAEAKSELGYIMAAPVDKARPKDDLEVKEDAGKLLREIGKDAK